MNLCDSTTVKRFLGTWLLLLATISVGCRSVDNAQVDLLERELRQQEDYIYELEDYLVEYSEKLRRCRCANHSPSGSATVRPKTQKPEIPEPELVDDLRSSRDDQGPVPDLAEEPLPTPGNAAKLPTGPDAVDPDRFEPDAIEPDAIDVEDLDEIEVPDLEIGPSARIAPEHATQIVAAAAQGPLVIPDPVDYVDEEERPTFAMEAPAPAEPGEPGPPAADQQAPISEEPNQDNVRQRADRVVIRRIMTDEPVDAEALQPGMLAVVEVQNELGEPIDVDGQVSLMVLTPADATPQRRVERWDFKSDEAQAAWQSSLLGDGMHLLLPLENGALKQREYELWARLVTEQGTKLLAKTIFHPDRLPTLAEAEASLMVDDPSRLELADGAPASRPESPRPTQTSGWKASSEPILRAADLRGNRPRSNEPAWTPTSRAARGNDRAGADAGRAARPTERWRPFD